MANKKTKEIAELINSIEVCHIMIADGFNRNLWSDNLKKATVELGDNFGIKLPMYTTYKNWRQSNGKESL